MPIYGYQCKCGQSFQTLVRSGDEPACPSCGSVELERQLSLIAEPAKGGQDNGGQDSAAPACSNVGSGPACGTCPGAAMFG